MKIARVDMAKGEVRLENVPELYRVLGGRGLTSQLVADEVEPTCHPLGAKNKLVVAPGLLSGTSAPCAGRLSVGFKSPLTGTIKETNVGGTAATSLAKLGLKALIIEGAPESDKLYLLKVSIDGVELIDASDLQGLGNYAVGESLRSRFGAGVSIISIGPAGESKLSAASIAVTDGEGRPVRHAGRGGGGAVMGSKGLKAIVIDDTGAPGVKIHDPDGFKVAARDFTQMLLDHPISGVGLPKYGTAVLINVLNEAGGLPTKNFRYGRFAYADDISGEKMYDIISGRQGVTTHECHPGCVMRCSQVYYDKDGNYLTAGFEYETIWAFGADCLIKDLDAIARLDRICDDIGIDTIEMGVTVAVAMDGGMIPWGDSEAAIGLLEEVGRGTDRGRIIGNGAAFTGKALGMTRVPAVKGQGFPAYDPRAVKGMGVTYATSTMGADHTEGYCVTANILKSGGYLDPLKKEGQVDLSRNLQIATAAIDSSGLCLFVAFTLLDNEKALPRVVDMLNSQYGLNLTLDDITELGKKVLKIEREFNHKAGFNEAHDRLPEFFSEELEPHGVAWDVSDTELDEVFNF